MEIKTKLAVIYETQIIDATTGRVVKRNAPKRNLLLDSGLDNIASNTFRDVGRYCVLGDGTKPTKRDSGAITVSIASGVATASSGYFEAEDVGRLLKLDSGQEVYIDGYTSSTEVSVTGAADDAASESTIWYVNETGHENELVRSSSLSSDSGDNSTTWDGSILEYKRTFLFPEETSSRTYREIGWSHTSSAGPNLLGRDIIPGGGDSISAGQQYKVIVKLQMQLSQTEPTAVSDVSGGNFDTSGQAMVITIRNAFEKVGSSNIEDFGDGLEPSAEKWVSVFKEDFSLPASTLTGLSSTRQMESDPDFEMSAMESYSPGSFERTFRRKYETSHFNGTIYGVGFRESVSVRTPNYAVKFDTPQTKDSNHTLELVFKLSWGRELTN